MLAAYEAESNFEAMTTPPNLPRCGRCNLHHHQTTCYSVKIRLSPAAFNAEINVKGAITSNIKHATKHKTSPARLAQLLHNCCSPHLAFCFSLQPTTAHRRHWLQAKTKWGLQQLCKSCMACFMFYCMFYFTCDRSFSQRMPRCARQMIWKINELYTSVGLSEVSAFGRVRLRQLHHLQQTPFPDRLLCNVVLIRPLPGRPNRK